MWPPETCPPEYPIHAFLEWPTLLHRHQDDYGHERQSYSPSERRQGPVHLMKITEDHVGGRSGDTHGDIEPTMDKPQHAWQSRRRACGSSSSSSSGETLGDIEYGLNKTSNGWWVYLINNKGVTKFTQTPEELEPKATARVTIDLRTLRAASLRELREDKDIAMHSDGNSVTIDVGPGDIRIIKITTRD